VLLKGSVLLDLLEDDSHLYRLSSEFRQTFVFTGKIVLASWLPDDVIYVEFITIVTTDQFLAPTRNRDPSCRQNKLTNEIPSDFGRRTC
jgi:hypothetical protein